MNDPKLTTITFANHRTATILLPEGEVNGDTLVASLSLPPYKAVILLIGSAEDLDRPLVASLTGLFNVGISRALSETGSLIIDGGTHAGVMKLTGSMVADSDFITPLIGVAPRGAVSYPNGPSQGVELDPNHSYFVLPEGTTWGSETKTLIRILLALTRGKGPTASDTPSVVILVAGGEVSQKELLLAVRHQYNIIIIKGSGGLADQLSTAWDNMATAPPTDPEILEILLYGKIQFHSLTDPTLGITRLIMRTFGDDKVLKQAWADFATYDLNSNLQQKRSNRLQIWIIIIGFLSAALAVVREVTASDTLKGTAIKTSTSTTPFSFTGHFLYDALGVILILLPITLTVLLSVASRFKQGNKWLLLRAAAELLKQEIFRYRTRAKYYNNVAQETLAKRLSDINGRLMSTDVNTSSLKTYSGSLPPKMGGAKGVDDGFSQLSPEKYLEVRLGDQLCYFTEKKIPPMELTLRLLNWSIFIIGGISTLLAALGQSIWITITTSFITSLSAYLAYRQTENRLVKYNRTAANLSNIKIWWNGLSAEDQSKQANIDILVDNTEQVLQSEINNWVQQMLNALAGLQKSDTNSGRSDQS